MILYSKLFLGKSVGRLEKKKIISKLKKNKPLNGVYCICFENNSPYLLEIMEPIEFSKEINRQKNYKIIGIAKGKKEAFKLVQEIISFVYRKHGDPKAVKIEFS